ncbi:uncharacterized protein [Procambarus clarkii]|nr:uncharacterized protein LOC123773881 [Procambarus clarkii]
MVCVRGLQLVVVSALMSGGLWAASVPSIHHPTSPKTDTSNRDPPLQEGTVEDRLLQLNTAKIVLPQRDTAKLLRDPQMEWTQEEEDGQLYRLDRHFSTFDTCADSLCDQVVRQAHGLARIKMVRKYIMETMTMMDSLVTALDAELVVAGETMTRALGNRCRAAHAVLSDVTKGPADSDRLNKKNSPFIYGGIPYRT